MRRILLACALLAIPLANSDAVVPKVVVMVDEQTALVAPNSYATIARGVGGNVVTLRSIEVRTGCGIGTGNTYDFAFYGDGGFDQGEELYVVVGQSLNYYDGAPPILRDSSATGQVRVKFWNRSVYPCTFLLSLRGMAF